MKNLGPTRRSILYLGFLSLSLCIIHSCSNGKTDDSKEIAEDQNEERFDDRKSEKDANFLVEVAAINLMEIELGKLAQQKGFTADVKALGEMMVEDHTATLNDLKALAADKSITIPEYLTEDGQDALEDLNEESGLDFDKEYSSMMVRGHKRAIRLFENASSDTEDSDIRNFASSKLPTIRGHLERSEECKKKVREMKK